ncbi:MAG: M48 family metallopeptidase [Planctomycetota bacterium]|jgi:predicted Zn-dependent protease
MASFFYKLGRMAGPKIRQAQWIWASVTAPEAEAIEAEYRVGAEMGQSVRTMSGSSENGENTELIQSIGNNLKPFIKNTLRKFSFECIDSDNPQAFCLPGGFIFISGSMIELCERDADIIAFICAHEMAHVVAGHAMDRMIANSVITTAAKTGPVRQLAGGVLNKLGIDFLQSAYSQDNEYQADEMALKLVKAAGFDPKSALKLFDKLSQYKHKPLLGKYFSTHPPCVNRAERLKQ